MISISISIALFVSFWFAPAKIIHELLVSIGVSNHLFGKSFIPQAIEFVISLILVLWVLRRPTIRERIATTSRGLWILRACNVISITYVLAQLFAASIPGGGPGFLVSQLAILTLIPAIFISIVVVIQIASRSFGIRWPVAALAIGALLVVPPVLRMYFQKSQVDGVWAQYCKESGDRFLSKPADFKTVQFLGMGEIEIFTSVVGQSYGEVHRDFVGASLIRRGFLQEYEDVNPAARLPPRRFYVANGVQEEALTTTRATHLVSISFPKSTAPQFQRLRMVVADAKTGLAIAESNRVVDNFNKRRRVCGEIKDGSLDASDFVAKALNLTSMTKK